MSVGAPIAAPERERSRLPLPSPQPHQRVRQLITQIIRSRERSSAAAVDEPVNKMISLKPLGNV